MHRTLFVCCLLCLSFRSARAEPPPSTLERADQPSGTAGKHAIYAELFGLGGAYGLGYDYRLGLGSAGTTTLTVGVGAVASAYEVDDERVLTLSPYLAAYPLVSGAHSWFALAGPRLVHRRVESPVDRWAGNRTTGVGAQLSSGYEYRGRLLVRVYVMAAAGGGGVAPWAGLSLGKSW